MNNQYLQFIRCIFCLCLQFEFINFTFEILTIVYMPTILYIKPM